jgi:hypothetical protein
MAGVTFLAQRIATFFRSLDNRLSSGSPRRMALRNLMRLRAQTSSRNAQPSPPKLALALFGCLIGTNRPAFPGVTACPIELPAISASVQAVSASEVSFVSGEPSLPSRGGSLQPLDRQVRYYRLLAVRARGRQGHLQYNRHQREPHPEPDSPLDSICTGTHKRRSFERRSRPCAGHWPPSKLWAMVISTAPATGSLNRFATTLVAALAECLLFCGLAWLSPAAGTSLAPSK